jgi:hypothetical protein
MRTNRERSKVTSRIRFAGSSAHRSLRLRRSHLSPLVLLCNIIRAAASNVNDEFAARSGLEDLTQANPAWFARLMQPGRVIPNRSQNDYGVSGREQPI